MLLWAVEKERVRERMCERERQSKDLFMQESTPNQFLFFLHLILL